MTLISLRNGTKTVSFAPVENGYRPEWFRIGNRPMLRFKDHEWLNVSTVRVTVGQIRSQSDSRIHFEGTIDFAGEAVDWSVVISIPEDGAEGFQIASHIAPRHESIEVLEALSAFELPYEYDESADSMMVMAQQPVYRYKGREQIDGPGYNHPNWYYARPGIAHLTYPSSSPLFVHRIAGADGGNERCTMILGDWTRCSFKDMFAVPTRPLRDDEASVFPDAALDSRPGMHGQKYLVGAANWNTSLHKDPNWVIDPGSGVQQQLILDFRESLDGVNWDGYLADGWERLAGLHYPSDGLVSAYDVARKQGATWTNAADWVATQFTKPEGMPGFFNPERGPFVYAPGTRPKSDNGVEGFAGQWAGPLALLGAVWGNESYTLAANRVEEIFLRDREQSPESVWTIGPTPLFAGVLRKAQIVGISPQARERVETYVRGRTQYLLDPPANALRGDGGILAWDAFANLLAADQFDKTYHEEAARRILAKVNAKLDDRFWGFNCAAEGDLVGAGQARPFGHAMAATANAMAYKRFGDGNYLQAAERFGNLLLAMHFITYNNSESPDLDTRGWANGSTGGRDQYCDLPPWETGMALEQIGHLIDINKARPGHYDVLWMFSRTGLAQFPIARTLKRLYTPDNRIVYRPIESLPSERHYYLRLPYMAYEEPWDQTLLAAYQGVEPIVESLMFGGGLVAANDDRVMAVAPGAATYDSALPDSFALHLWNPTGKAIETRLFVTAAARRGLSWSYSGDASESGSTDNAETLPIMTPPRAVVKLRFNIG